MTKDGWRSPKPKPSRNSCNATLLGRYTPKFSIRKRLQSKLALCKMVVDFRKHRICKGATGV